jgi:hypothetical protein
MAPLAAATLLFLAERGAAATLLSPTERDARLFALVSIVADAPAALIGGPAYLVLKGRARPTIENVVATGGAVAVFPWPILLATTSQPDLRAGMVVIGELLVAGLAGGLVFWICAAWRNPGLVPRVTD